MKKLCKFNNKDTKTLSKKVVVMSLLLTLKRFRTLFWCFYYWFWTSIWDKVFKNGPSNICGRRSWRDMGCFRVTITSSNFLKAVFHKFYFVYSSIFCPICQQGKGIYLISRSILIIPFLQYLNKFIFASSVYNKWVKIKEKKEEDLAEDFCISKCNFRCKYQNTLINTFTFYFVIGLSAFELSGFNTLNQGITFISTEEKVN